MKYKNQNCSYLKGNTFTLFVLSLTHNFPLWKVPLPIPPSPLCKRGEKIHPGLPLQRKENKKRGGKWKITKVRSKLFTLYPLYISFAKFYLDSGVLIYQIHSICKYT